MPIGLKCILSKNHQSTKPKLATLCSPQWAHCWVFLKKCNEKKFVHTPPSLSSNGNNDYDDDDNDDNDDDDHDNDDDDHDDEEY